MNPLITKKSCLRKKKFELRISKPVFLRDALRPLIHRRLIKIMAVYRYPSQHAVGKEQHYRAIKLGNMSHYRSKTIGVLILVVLTMFYGLAAPSPRRGTRNLYRCQDGKCVLKSKAFLSSASAINANGYRRNRGNNINFRERSQPRWISYRKYFF